MGYIARMNMTNHSRAFLDIEKILSICEGAYSPNTLRGYRKDLECFKSWCNERGADWLPAEPEVVSNYVDDISTTLSIATVKRRLCAIRFAHFIADLDNPIVYSSVHLSVRRALLSKRRRPVQSLGLTEQILQEIVGACGECLIGRRDAALISVGYDTLCRSSELAAMRIEHIRSYSETISIFVPLSKSDPFGDGRWTYLSPKTTELLRCWLKLAMIREGSGVSRVTHS